MQIQSGHRLEFGGDKTGLFTLMLDGVISSLIGRSTPVRVHVESSEWKDVDLVFKITTG